MIKQKANTINWYREHMPDYMKMIESSGSRLELHHLDPNLKYKNYRRYCEYRIEDVIPLSQKEHLRLHKFGKKHSPEHNTNIKNSMKLVACKKKINGKKIVKLEKDGIVKYFKTGLAAAKWLKCSRQLVYQVLSEKVEFISYRTAKGWNLSLIPFDKNIKLDK